METNLLLNIINHNSIKPILDFLFSKYAINFLWSVVSTVLPIISSSQTLSSVRLLAASMRDYYLFYTRLQSVVMHANQQIRVWFTSPFLVVHPS